MHWTMRSGTNFVIYSFPLLLFLISIDRYIYIILYIHIIDVTFLSLHCHMYDY